MNGRAGMRRAIEVDSEPSAITTDQMDEEKPSGKTDYVRWSEQDLDPALVDPINRSEWE